MSQAIIFDTETTGIDGQIIQIGVVEFVENRLSGETISYGQDYKASVPIQFGAMAVHHILDEDLVDCPPNTEFALPEGLQYMIGHNVDFDWKMAGSPESVKRICTLAMSRKLYPEDSHTLSAMIYRLHPNKAEARNMVQGAHNAKADVEMTLWLLRELVKGQEQINSWETLWQFSEACRIPDVISFGKHKGMAIKDLPQDYVSWLKKQPDLDVYLLAALNVG